MQKILLGIAFALGGIITYVATRPEAHFAVIAIALFILAFFFGFIQPKYPWLFALVLGIWIPLFGLFRLQNLWTILALVVAFAGTYSGAALRIKLFPKKS
ncbi:MAG TPA: hypothetical protein PLG50_00935 [bacterium]|nr:hypothetical protein [bacterium]HQG44206.1 hypothetical protein [bacterium]HQI47725.1 hypothetical protein [bacterium]HQJ64086.1 hypothetical protein [bacterium]